MTVGVSRLPNGIHVLTDHMPHLETLALGVWVKAGARDELADHGGVAHLLEHMAFKGTSRRTAMEIASQIENVGGEINAATGMETTAYFSRVLKDDWPLALEILADILTDPVFDAAELEKEKYVILQEIAAANDAPDDLVFELLNEAAFPGHPLGRSILGDAARVARYDARSITSYRNLHYTAPRIVLAAAGHVDHQTLVEAAEKRFSSFRSGVAAEWTSPVFHGGCKSAERPLDQLHLVFGFSAPGYRDEKIYALQLLSSIMGGGMSSRLFQELREKRGLCYSIFSFASSYQDIGLLNVYAATSPENARDLSDVATDVMLSMTEKVDEPELQRAKAQLKAGLVMSLESASGRADQIARQFLAFGKVPEISDLVSRIERLTRDDIRNLAGEILISTRPAISAVGSLKYLAMQELIAAKFGSSAE
jgi:predicted Zn-dependent peptidase